MATQRCAPSPAAKGGGTRAACALSGGVGRAGGGGACRRRGRRPTRQRRAGQCARCAQQHRSRSHRLNLFQFRQRRVRRSPCRRSRFRRSPFRHWGGGEEIEKGRAWRVRGDWGGNGLEVAERVGVWEGCSVYLALPVRILGVWVWVGCGGLPSAPGENPRRGACKLKL